MSSREKHGPGRSSSSLCLSSFRNPKYGPPSRTGYRLIVGNLSSSVSWQDLKDFMRQAGPVIFADAHKFKPNIGVVDFESYSGMKAALEKLDGTKLCGHRIWLEEDKPQYREHRSPSGSRSRDRSLSPGQRKSFSKVARSRSRSRNASPYTSRFNGHRSHSNDHRPLKSSHNRCRSKSFDAHRSFPKSRSPSSYKNNYDRSRLRSPSFSDSSHSPSSPESFSGNRKFRDLSSKFSSLCSYTHRVNKYGVPRRTEYRLIVDNLTIVSSRVSWQDLKDFMRKAGPVTFANAHKPVPNVGVVDFESYSGMKTALEKFDGIEFCGRRIWLEEDKPQNRGQRSLSGSRDRSPSPKRLKFSSNVPRTPSQSPSFRYGNRSPSLDSASTLDGHTSKRNHNHSRSESSNAITYFRGSHFKSRSRSVDERSRSRSNSALK